MADLTRLRSTLSARDSPVLALGGVMHHMSRDPTRVSLFDADSVGSMLGWLASAPLPMFGPFLSASGMLPLDIKELSSSLTPQDLSDIASYANAMSTADGEWDRSTRNDQSRRVALHAEGAARVNAQSSVEFASLDLLTELGIDGVDAAVSAFADVTNVYRCKTAIIAHQFARSRHAVFARFVLPTGKVRLVITPWCLSRPNAKAVAAVMVNDLRRTIVTDRMVRRAQTAMNFMSRLSLQSVRDTLASATSLLTRYSYDSSKMAFVHPDTGAIFQTTATRQLSVAVAFSYVFTRGSGDALMELADYRAAALDQLIDSAPPQVHEYFEGATAPIDALSLFSRALLTTRLLRDKTQESAMRSKGSMLGYLARARTKHDRNTAACINRLEEVIALMLSHGHERGDLLIVLEWGGTLNHASVLAAAALAGVDIALDVAASGLDLPGGDVLSDDQDPAHRYQLYLSSAQGRSLPRVPTSEYLQGEPLHSRLAKLMDSLAGTLPQHKVVFIAGGVQHALETPVSVCIDAVARHSAVRDIQSQIGAIFVCAEVLLPPACEHSASASPEVFLDTGTLVDDECSQCQEHSRAVSVLVDMVSSPDTRLVKPRSIHGHNAYFSSETLFGEEVSSDTMRTLDAAVSLTHARNVEFGEEGDPGLGVDAFESAHLSGILKSAVLASHSALSGGSVASLEIEKARKIAESVHG
nr:hypothetical protein [Cladosporium ramotenellum polymycovirus 1]WEW73477.1 hypothetical protein [Cladosporium ramotenellum polymycovirus 1]